MVADIANASMDGHHTSPPHLFKGTTDTPTLSDRAPEPTYNDQKARALPEKQVHTLAQVDIYLDDFILTCQCIPQEGTQILCHICRGIDTVFWPNAANNCIQNEPISTRKLLQGDGAMSTKKEVLRRDIDTKKHHLRITPKRDEKVRYALSAIPTEARQVSLHK